MKKLSDVLITGSHGLVGSEMTFGEQIGRSDVDLTDRKQTIQYFNDTKPKWVIHCAGLVGGVNANMSRKAEFFNENMLITSHILEACHIADVPNLIAFMSTCIFPEKHAQAHPLFEDMIHDGVPHESNDAYAYAKRMVDVGINAYKQQFKKENWFSIIPTNLYGKNDNYNLENSHFIPALIRKAHIAKTTNTDFVVWGTGKSIREFVYAGDIARLIYDMINTNFHSKYDKIIVAPDDYFTIEEVAEIIASKFDLVDIIYDTTKPNGQHQKISNNDRFNELFPNFKFTSLTDGLDQTINYYLNNQHKIRQ